MGVITILIFVHYKVNLFIDNCPAHPHSFAIKLEAIKLVFFPPNLSSKLQLCDLGIIRSMKHYYREKIVKAMVNCVEKEIDFPNINVLDAIITMAEIWTVYVAIDAHAMTCDVLTDEDLLEIVQFRTDYTNETEKEQVELDSVPLQPTKMNLDAAKKTVHVSLLHKDLVTNEMFCSKFFFVKKHLI
jgi:hypothetical protein